MHAHLLCLDLPPLPTPQQSARLGGSPLRLPGPQATASTSLDLPGSPGLIHLHSPGQKLNNENPKGAQRMLERTHLQDCPTPSLVLRRSVRTPQCGRAKNYSLGAHQGGTWRLSLSRVPILKLGQNSPLLQNLQCLPRGLDKTPNPNQGPQGLRNGGAAWSPGPSPCAALFLPAPSSPSHCPFHLRSERSRGGLLHLSRQEPITPAQSPLLS